jgi:hypothetical protein
VTTLATVPLLPSWLVERNGALYWVNQDDGTVVTVPAAGGTVATLAGPTPGLMGLIGITADDSSLYFTTNIPGGCTGGIGMNGSGASSGSCTNPMGTVQKIPLDGTAGSLLESDGQHLPTGLIAVDATSVYWVDVQGELLATPSGGGTTRTLAQIVNGGFVAIAVDGTSVYWTAGDGVYAVPRVGGPATALATGNRPLGTIAIDDANVYWTTVPAGCNGSCTGTIAKVPKGGGAMTTLISGLSYPGGIAGGLAVDATSVYWTNDCDPLHPGDGTVQRLTPK